MPLLGASEPGKVGLIELEAARHVVVPRIENIAAAASSVVEYLPDMTMPYWHSRYFQRLVLHPDPEATVIVGENSTAGRGACGERHCYDIFIFAARRTPTCRMAGGRRLAPSPRSSTRARSR